jgi:Polysaccharide lyase
MIISCSLGIGIVDSGIIDVRIFIGTAAANGAAATVSSSARNSTDSAGRSPASPALNVTVAPSITSFSGANGSRITIDGTSAMVQNANQPWSLTEPDANTLQFSVHSGDHWSTTGWSDLTNDFGAERSEIALSPNYSPGTQINVDYQLTVEPGSANTAKWLLLNQFHATTEGSPPFAIYMNGEHMVVSLRYQAAGQAATSVDVWRDPNPIQRGHAYDMNVQVNFDPNGNGYLNVWREGVRIVNYHGAIGMAGASYYWKEGVYRGPAPETFTASFSNLHITTGAADPHGTNASR